MRKLFNNPRFVAVAAVLALLLVANSVWSRMKGPITHPNVTATAVVESGGDESQPANAPVLDVREALKALPPLNLARDPFAARGRTEASQDAKVVEADLVDTVHLSAIWTQNNTTLVLINDRISQAGDEFGRIKIESATQEGVWVTHWKGRDFLSLGGDFTLRTPAQTARNLGASPAML